MQVMVLWNKHLQKKAYWWFFAINSMIKYEARKCLNIIFSYFLCALSLKFSIKVRAKILDDAET
uniref:CSON002718 protein n=1 Tax=Culicoides sonorensis TaxID=179676 RepID=A0A336MNC0_CULSO